MTAPGYAAELSDSRRLTLIPVQTLCPASPILRLTQRAVCAPAYTSGIWRSAWPGVAHDDRLRRGLAKCALPYRSLPPFE